MNRITLNTVFFLISGHLFSTPDNLNLFQFPLKVRVIDIRLYYFMKSMLARKDNFLSCYKRYFF